MSKQKNPSNGKDYDENDMSRDEEYLDEAALEDNCDDDMESEFDEEDFVSLDSKMSEPESRDNSDDDYTEEDFEIADGDGSINKNAKKKGHKGLIIVLAVLGVIALFAMWVGLTESGRRFGLGFVAKFVHSNLNNEEKLNEEQQVYIDPNTNEQGEFVDENGQVVTKDPDTIVIDTGYQPRKEDYVTTYLIFGIEEIGGASNTDAMMLVSINTKDNTIKLTSIMRDTYVKIPGWDSNKLNSAYAKGAHGASTVAEARKNGAALLISTIENTFDIDISGYACVNFDSFEKIVDRLGGIDIELGSREAKYLCKTNYISNPANRNVTAGWNHLNGNQALGYCRVRKEMTIDGINNDYGRTSRHRKVINAIIKKYKDSAITELIPIMKDCLGYISTDLTEEQITNALYDVLTNHITETKSFRLPADELFYDSSKKGINNGSRNITYALVMGDDTQKNIDKLHEFIFGSAEQVQ